MQRGNLTLSVSANGTLQPTRSVNIGSELSGTVRNVLVDVNDRVRKGQLLVELDTAKLTDQLTKSRATLSAAQAKVAQTVVTVKEAQAQPRAARRGVAPVGRQGAGQERARQCPRHPGTRPGRRGQRARQRGRSAGRCVQRRDQPVQGLHPFAD